MDDGDGLRPGPEEARQALASVGLTRRRAMVEAPSWLYWGIGACLVAAGLAQMLRGVPEYIGQGLVLAAMLVLSFAAQRRSGVVRRVTRPPRWTLLAWMAFVVLITVVVFALNAAGRAGFGTLGFFALAVLIVPAGPYLRRLWTSL